MDPNRKERAPLSAAKRVIFGLVTLLLTVVLILIIAEMIVRLLSPQQEAMRWHVSSERYGFAMKRNFFQRYHYLGSDFTMEIRTNSMGLRDKEYDLTRSDQKRLLLLGDSFTFGYGVNAEDDFDNKLEELLNRREDESWIVINAGHGGWGTLQELRYARDHLALFKPDIIVLTFCGNDPSDDLLFSQGMKDSERGVLYFPGKVFIRNHSHLYRFLSSRYKYLLHDWLIQRKLENASHAESLRVDEQSASVITEEEWKRTLECVRAFQRDFLSFRPEGILLVQASAPLNESIRTHLISLSNGRNLLYVGLYDDFVSLTPGQIRMPHDGHWSPLVHSISAKNLYKTIVTLQRHLTN